MAWNIELSPFRSLESEIFDLVADEIMAEESDAFMHDLIHHLHYVGIGEKERLIESNCQYYVFILQIKNIWAVWTIIELQHQHIIYTYLLLLLS